MSTAPVVENLNDLISTIGQGVAGQKAQYDQQIADNQKAGDAQVAGLEAKKTQAFEDITQQSQNKGMFFSGFSPDAQAKYTAGTYLPALAQLQATIASTRNNLLMGKNKLDTDVFNTAYGTQQTERGNLFSYNQQQDSFANQEKMQQEANAFADDQRQKTQAFQAGQAAADRAAAAAAASIRASQSSGSQPTQAQIQQADAASLAQQMAKSAGGDGYVSPNTYKAAKDSWVQAGYSSQLFDNQFSNYRNPSNKNYKVG